MIMFETLLIKLVLCPIAVHLKMVIYDEGCVEYDEVRGD